jgi:D-arabinose 1-dehydrogenase-like Zn-dependent alcohol dehydrogenase
MFPADERAAIPSPRQVEYASIEWLTCGLQTPSSESAIAAESETERVGVVGAVASVSAGISLMPA